MSIQSHALFWPCHYDPYNVICQPIRTLFHMHIFINQPIRHHHYYSHSVISHASFSKACQILYTNDACGVFLVWMKNELQIYKSCYQTMSMYYIIVPCVTSCLICASNSCLDSYAVTMHVAPLVSASIMKLKEMKQSHLNKMEIHPLTCFFYFQIFAVLEQKSSFIQ